MPKDVEMSENPGVDGKTSFNTFEQWNGFIAQSLHLEGAEEETGLP